MVELNSLNDLLGLQDRVRERNQSAAQAEFELIERGLTLGWSVTFWLNQDPVLTERKAKQPEVVKAETICINLLHAAWSGLVNATRLAFYGAFVDALNLTRSALEATYHAEYFQDHPDDALEWDRAGALTDLEERRRFIQKFERSSKIRDSVASKYPGDKSLHAFFYELSTYGSHANPITVGIRLSSPLTGVASLGYLSVGYREAPVLCASHILHTLAYTLSEYFAGFRGYLEQSQDLLVLYEKFDRAVTTWRSHAPRALSLIR